MSSTHSSTTRRGLVALVLAAGLVGGGIGIAHADNQARLDNAGDTTVATESTDATAQQQGKHSRGDRHRGDHKGQSGERAGRGMHNEEKAQEFADALGVSVDQWTTAWNDVHAQIHESDTRPTRAEVTALLAEKLGKTTAEVESAFTSVRHNDPRFQQRAAALAESLGVDKDAVITALDELHAEREAAENNTSDDADRSTDRAARRDEFAAALAEKLGLNKDDVAATLAENNLGGGHGHGRDGGGRHGLGGSNREA